MMAASVDILDEVVISDLNISDIDAFRAQQLAASAVDEKTDGQQSEEFEDYPEAVVEEVAGVEERVDGGLDTIPIHSSCFFIVQGVFEPTTLLCTYVPVIAESKKF